MTMRVKDIDAYLLDLYNEVVRVNRNSELKVDIYIMGGTAVMINNKFRESTVDIDAYIRSTLDLNEPIKMVATKNNLPEDWLNTNVTVTQSFNKRLLPYFELYKEIDGKFKIYVINNIAQLCMKMVSFRVDSTDVTDIKGIVESDFNYTYDEVMDSIENIYGDDSVLQVDAQLYVYQLLERKGKSSKNILTLAESILGG